MNTAKKHNHVQRNRYVTVAAFIVLVALLTIFGLVMFNHKQTDAATTPKKTTTVATPSDFTFTGASGWTEGPHNKTSMALFHQGDDGCFSSAEYYTGTIDINAALQKNYDDLAGSGHTATDIGTQPLTIQTDTGAKQYDLHQYQVTNADDGDQVMGGNEIGYLQLTGGYLKIYANCNTADELASALPALQAYKFSPVK